MEWSRVREGKGREWKGREGKGREGKGREGKGREEKEQTSPNALTLYVRWNKFLLNKKPKCGNLYGILE